MLERGYEFCLFHGKILPQGCVLKAVSPRRQAWKTQGLQSAQQAGTSNVLPRIPIVHHGPAEIDSANRSNLSKPFFNMLSNMYAFVQNF